MGVEVTAAELRKWVSAEAGGSLDESIYAGLESFYVVAVGRWQRDDVCQRCPQSWVEASVDEVANRSALLL